MARAGDAEVDPIVSGEAASEDRTRGVLPVR